VRPSGSAVPGPRVGGERGGSAAGAGACVRRGRRSGNRRLAGGVPSTRHRLSPCADRHAVRRGASAARVTFLHPLVLLGLAAAAIPALLHLLERRVPPEAEFPPLQYLREAERQSARRLKLRHLLLLMLRTALIVLIVLAAARPLLPSHASGARLVHEPTALAVILDNSPSSGAVIDGHPMLDRLKATARASLIRASAADRLWLVLADGVARGGTREALLATVDSVGVSPLRLDLTAAVRAAARLVDAEPLAAREVHVASDLQRSALGPGRAAVPRGVRVLALAPLERVPENRGIGAVQVTDAAVAVSVVGAPGAGADAAPARVEGRSMGGRPAAGSKASVGVPPADPARLGEVNRARAERGGRWRFGPVGTPGPIAGTVAPERTPVGRRYRLEEIGQDGAKSRDSTVLARVNGEPWLVRDGSVLLIGSRLDTAWTALPATPGFVPFLDALVNRLARNEAPVIDAEGVPRVEFRIRSVDTLGATVFGPDPRESDLTPAAPGLARDVLGAEVLDDASFAAARFAGTGRSDVSGVLLTVALLLPLA